MFKIEFDPKLGAFIILIQRFAGLHWARVHREGKPASFSTYDEAAKHAEAIGLTTLYQDRSANRYREYMRDDVRADIRAR